MTSDTDSVPRARAPMTGRPVIVGAGGRTGSQDALTLGRRMAAALDAPLVPVTAPPGSRPAEVLHDAAVERDAAMIVVGSTHRGRIGRVLPGSVARRLLTSAPCPVAVAPAGMTDAALRRVGVGFEPTPEGHAALMTAHRIAARTGAELVAIGVVLPLAPLDIAHWQDPAPFVERERRTVRAGLEHALAELHTSVPVGADARIGSAAEQLAAASEDLDLLVCGSRGRGPVRTAVLGSVTEALMSRAVCPVLLIPRPDSFAPDPGAALAETHEP